MRNEYVMRAGDCEFCFRFLYYVCSCVLSLQIHTFGTVAAYVKALNLYDSSFHIRDSINMSTRRCSATTLNRPKAFFYISDKPLSSLMRKEKEECSGNKIFRRAVADTKCCELVDAPQTSEQRNAATERNLVSEIT